MTNLIRTTPILFLAGLLLLGCGDKIEPGHTELPESAPVPLAVVRADRKVEPLVYEAVGTVRARVSSTVSSKLLGTIQALAVKEGDRVQKDDLLVQLDDREVVAQLQQAQAALDEAGKAESAAMSNRIAAEAGARQARLSYERNQTLLAANVVTRETFEAAETEHEQSQAALAHAEALLAAARYRVRQSRAALDAARVAQMDARILAPYEGQVTAKLVEAGALAVPGTPLLTLEGKGGYRVDLVLPESYLQHVRQGDTVAVHVPAVRESPYDGRVEVVIPAADADTRSVVVQVGLPGDEALRSGMFARTALHVGEAPSFRIPASAVVRHGQLTGVFILDERDRARFRLVRTGRTYGSTVEVISGIAPGALLVAAPPPGFANGAVVEPLP